MSRQLPSESRSSSSPMLLTVEKYLTVKSEKCKRKMLRSFLGDDSGEYNQDINFIQTEITVQTTF